jgi:isoprenylcysteine carboxyl methyltransferase (ICMT) family protein YpbQ
MTDSERKELRGGRLGGADTAAKQAAWGRLLLYRYVICHDLFYLGILTERWIRNFFYDPDLVPALILILIRILIRL